MRFTIGIPVRNGERFLSEAIASALSQVRPADEILVVDDASTDDSSRIARSPEWGGRIRYIYNDRPTGFVDAFNRIARLAQSDYVVILSCDDLLDEKFLFYVEQALKKYPSVRHCYTGYCYIDETGMRQGVSPEPHTTEPVLYSGITYAHRYLQGVLSGRHINRCLGIAIERNLLMNKCPFRKEAGLIADDDLFVRIGAFTDVVGVSQPLVSVRSHSSSVTGRIGSLSLRLAEDYLFQVRSTEDHAHLDPHDIQIYHALAAKFINALFLDGLRTGNEEWIVRAIALRICFEKEIPGYMQKTLPYRSKILWNLVQNNTDTRMLFKAYAKVFPGIRRLKRLVVD